MKYQDKEFLSLEVQEILKKELWGEVDFQVSMLAWRSATLQDFPLLKYRPKFLRHQGFYVNNAIGFDLPNSQKEMSIKVTLSEKSLKDDYIEETSLLLLRPTNGIFHNNELNEGENPKGIILPKEALRDEGSKTVTLSTRGKRRNYVDPLRTLSDIFMLSPKTTIKNSSENIGWSHFPDLSPNDLVRLYGWSAIDYIAIDENTIEVYATDIWRGAEGADFRNLVCTVEFSEPLEAIGLRLF